MYNIVNITNVYQAFSSRFLCVGGSSSDLLHTCVDLVAVLNAPGIQQCTSVYESRRMYVSAQDMYCVLPYEFDNNKHM